MADDERGSSQTEDEANLRETAEINEWLFTAEGKWA